MTDGEWDLLVVECYGMFRGARPWEPEKEAALKMVFGAVPLDAARACVRHLVMAGQVYDPAPGELVGALRQVAGSDWRFQCLLAGLTSAQLAAVKQREAERLLEAQSEHTERRRTAVESMREIRAELEAGHEH